MCIVCLMPAPLWVWCKFLKRAFQRHCWRQAVNLDNNNEWCWAVRNLYDNSTILASWIMKTYMGGCRFEVWFTTEAGRALGWLACSPRRGLLHSWHAMTYSHNASLICVAIIWCHSCGLLFRSVMWIPISPESRTATHLRLLRTVSFSSYCRSRFSVGRGCRLPIVYSAWLVWLWWLQCVHWIVWRFFCHKMS